MRGTHHFARFIVGVPASILTKACWTETVEEIYCSQKKKKEKREEGKKKEKRKELPS